ncbi:hypothetical protein Avbf_04820 [Armadillidium vulgare]|nr:hypothetical protein Avbf_04820 [Armadillidium vulgare]
MGKACRPSTLVPRLKTLIQRVKVLKILLLYFTVKKSYFNVNNISLQLSIITIILYDLYLFNKQQQLSHLTPSTIDLNMVFHFPNMFKEFSMFV